MNDQNLIDLSKCQYCYLKYEECTCCRYCGFLANTCQCHLEGDYPCIKYHPTNMYKSFYTNPTICEMFGIYTIEDIDRAVMRLCNKDVWPERLRNK